MKIAVVGMSDAGLTDALLLAQHSEFFAMDVGPKRASHLGRRVLQVEDADIESLLRTGRLNHSATLDLSLIHI